jgi:hypothetical protein
MGSDGAPPGGWSCGNTRRKFPQIRCSKRLWRSKTESKFEPERRVNSAGLRVAPSRLSIAGRRHIFERNAIRLSSCNKRTGPGDQTIFTLAADVDGRPSYSATLRPARCTRI